MPLPDGCADAVFVSTAWHWLNPDLAVPEIARVLRPGGRLGVVWTSRDRREDWVAELDLLRLPGIDAPTRAGTARTRDDVRARLRKEHSVTLPDGAEFGAPAAASFRFTRTLAVDDVVEWLATNSSFITASAADRAAGLDRCRAALLRRTGGAEVIEMPLRSWCWRAERAGSRVTEKLGYSSKRFHQDGGVGASPTICMWQRSTAVGHGGTRPRRTGASRPTGHGAAASAGSRRSPRSFSASRGSPWR
jgi:SAM-dependent methyltransferase